MSVYSEKYLPKGTPRKLTFEQTIRTKRMNDSLSKVFKYFSNHPFADQSKQRHFQKKTSD